jgi:hypothetical protein
MKRHHLTDLSAVRRLQRFIDQAYWRVFLKPLAEQMSAIQQQIVDKYTTTYGEGTVYWPKGTMNRCNAEIAAHPLRRKLIAKWGKRLPISWRIRSYFACPCDECNEEA